MAKRCAICQNGYQTQHVCKACRQDPANSGWVETSGDKSPNGGAPREVSVAEYRPTDRPAVFDGAVHKYEFTDAERVVALYIWFGYNDAEIARFTGYSRMRVGRIRKMFMGSAYKPNFSWMSEESQRIIVCIGQNLSDEEIINSLDVTEDHVARIRALLEKAQRHVKVEE